MSLNFFFFLRSEYVVELKACNYLHLLILIHLLIYFHFFSYNIQIRFKLIFFFFFLRNRFKLIWCNLHQLINFYYTNIFKTISLVLYIFLILNAYSIFISIKFYLTSNVSCILFNLIIQKNLIIDEVLINL